MSPGQLRPIDHIAEVRCPVLIIGGSEDLHTSAEDTRMLYDAAPELRQLWMIPGAAHIHIYLGRR